MIGSPPIRGRTLNPRLPGPLACALLCLVLAPAARAAQPVSQGEAPRATPSLLRELARGAEELPILIGVRDGTPSARTLLANPDPEGEPERRQIRVLAQQRLADEIPYASFRPKYFYESFSMMAGTATREAAVALANHPDVAWVAPDRQARLYQATPQSGQSLINSSQTNSLGFTGAGQTIAVLDTGLDYRLESLGGPAFPNAKVIGGMDVADNDGDPMDCEGHGTEVAGVAAGPTGVAPNAKIVAVKVFSSEGTTNASCKDTASFSTIIQGINYAITNRATFGITVINLSLGGAFDDDSDHGYCDKDEPGSATAIDAATAAGIAVVVASGNDGLTNQLSVSACVSSAISIGAVYSDSRSRVSWSDGSGGVLCTDQPATPDAIVCFSNSASNLTLLAPGAFWKVAAKGGGTDSGFAGTSAAVPAASGAIALLRQARPELSPGGVVAILRETGKPIADSRNGVVTPRLDTLAAVQLAATSLSSFAGTAVDIPDGTGSATATVTITGFVRPLAAVHALVQIDHNSPQQLRVTLTGPDGTTVVLQDQQGKSEHPINSSYGKTDASAQSLSAFSGKQANGTWTLKVEDLVPGTTGRIKNFAITLVPGQPIEPVPAAADGRVLPVVAHIQGTKFFLSDVRLYNPSAFARTFALYFVGLGQTGATASKDTRTVGPGQVLALNDIIASEYNVESIGEITVLSNDANFLVVSRAYTQGDNGTFGLFVPGVRTTSGLSIGAGQATANGLARVPGFHTNVGFTEVSGAPVTVRIDVLDGAGTLLASTRRQKSANETEQITDIIADRGLSSMSNFRVDFTVESLTGRIVPFASYVDEATGDGSFQAALNPPASADDVIVAQSSHVTGANSDFFKTNLDITNLDSKPVTVTVSLIPLLLAGTPNPPRVYTIQPGQTLEKLDVLLTEFGLADPSAAGLRIHPAAPARLAVSTRTYVEKFGGTFGFSIPGVAAGTAIGVGSPTATVIQLDQTSSANGYRSNFGFTEVAGADAVVRVTVKSGDAGVALGSKSYSIPANTSFQINVQDILGAGVTANNIYLQFNVDSGAGRVIPYGAAVDNKSGDAIFMLAE